MSFWEPLFFFPYLYIPDGSRPLRRWCRSWSSGRGCWMCCWEEAGWWCLKKEKKKKKVSHKQFKHHLRNTKKGLFFLVAFLDEEIISKCSSFTVFSPALLPLHAGCIPLENITHYRNKNETFIMCNKRRMLINNRLRGRSWNTCFWLDDWPV